MDFCSSEGSLGVNEAPPVDSITLSQHHQELELELDEPHKQMFEESNSCSLAKDDRCCLKSESLLKTAQDKDEELLVVRLERSNSCSQAEKASIPEHFGSASSHTEIQYQPCSTATIITAAVAAAAQLTSLSHDNLATNVCSSPSVAVTASLESIPQHHLSACEECPKLVEESNSGKKQQQKEEEGTKKSLSSSGRFFTSKLNTGSLWSLLSVGSNSSTTTLDTAASDEASQMGQQQLDNPANQAGSSNFFARSIVQFKRSSQDHPHPPQDRAAEQSSQKRFRFSLKYVGSAMLHKNFTLPMLEWIVKDIKRQTIRGAKSTSQRQFCIPTRDVIFEIQASQLRAISCKDGHCVLVHPMHCVSKYVQLQHDPNCFSYLIRDSKNAPTFCHIYQAKSATKVHEIFTAIRETTTTSSLIGQHQRSICAQPAIQVDTAASFPVRIQQHSQSSTAEFGVSSEGTVQSQVNVQQASKQQQQQLQQDNSYQFEVMFVKRVKLQCRRVPSSFVDDALETLRSFEVLKVGAESKGSSAMKALGKGRGIISVSVDERQEYDELTPQQPQASQDHSAQQLLFKLTQAQQKVPHESRSIQNERRGSSASLHQHQSDIAIQEEEQDVSRSCQQSPNKQSRADCPTSETISTSAVHGSALVCELSKVGLAGERSMKKHQSADCLNWPDSTTEASYLNDFSPYNTITSSDLNERIAAIPVVSSSISLDHKTRQKLARQVRETIMATAANIKDPQNALALASTSATLFSQNQQAQQPPAEVQFFTTNNSVISSTDQELAQRRASTGGNSLSHIQQQQYQQTGSNNFDLFRRASTRQVVKNRTMLLLISKEDLCAISIDKHQMLFSKSFSSIVHCLQGSSNRDHFGLICRESSKINPQAEAYAGFIFKCQSEKVVCEIMSALKQVIYSSQHNYHGLNSIYNPLSALNQPSSCHVISNNRASSTHLNQPPNEQSDQYPLRNQQSLASKRGFSSYPIEIAEAARHNGTSGVSSCAAESYGAMSTSSCGKVSSPAPSLTWVQPKNLIKSMFCDQCPLYWYHRLCIDIESLPADSSKAIILRRIDSSFSEKEQDELYSRFSEFSIESISEHNEIFMSLLRHLCERNQLKHSQTSAHMSAMAKNLTLLNNSSVDSSTKIQHPTTTGAIGHQRSSSSGGSLAYVLGHSSNTANHSIVDASSAAIDNFKKAKNSISSSIENILKRRGSTAFEEAISSSNCPLTASSSSCSRSGSFKHSTNNRPESEKGDSINNNGFLKKSRSTTEYNSNNKSQQQQPSSSYNTWKGSLSRTINEDLSINPLFGIFRRQNSYNTNSKSTANERTDSTLNASDDSLTHNSSDGTNSQHSPNVKTVNQGNSPKVDLESNTFTFRVDQRSGGVSPSSVLSSAFWKKSIFDKIRQPLNVDKEEATTNLNNSQSKQTSSSNDTPSNNITFPKRRSREELRALWKKAIHEQITLLKMEKQNRRLQLTIPAECDDHHLKLNYRDFIHPRDVFDQWDKLLKQNPTKKVEFKEVARLVGRGVPKNRRGEIWMFLMNQYQLRHGTSFQPADSEFHGDANQTYRDLLSRLSSQQHEIFVDIGRTFPLHPYYSQYLSIGQLSLFNLLKAYSLLDPEVGYCQGLSFVAGILLLHVNVEDEAFELMRHFLFNFGLRKQYLPSMNALHLQLYQITRLLRDYEYDLFDHFDQYDISPSLYAAPWFLTLFASQFQLTFVARLFDLISLIGIEAIFRVSLNLLNFHRSSILLCDSLESTMDYMKNDLVNIDDTNLIKIFDKSMPLDLRNKLIEYEIEYTFYCAEDRAKQNQTTKSRYNSREVNEALPSLSTLTVKDISLGHLSTQDESVTCKEISNESIVADATATIIIQHLLANNHLKSLQSNYSY